jgi:hypothetical protein
LNPAAYVRATVCILQWAFVPTTLGTSSQTIQDAINGTAIGTITTVIGDLAQPIQDIDTTTPFDCMGPKMSYSVSYWNNGAPLEFYPFQACEPTAAGVATFVRTFTTFTLYTGTVLASLHLVAGTFGIRLRGGE